MTEPYRPTPQIEASKPISQEDKERLDRRRKIAVATTTFYKGWSSAEDAPMTEDQLRGNLAIRMLSTAKEMGYQLAVVDGGSSPEFIEALKKHDINISSQKEKGMSASRRQVFEEASVLNGVEVICWTEPEKILMIENLLQAAQPVLDGEADIVIPARTEEGFASYPPQQAYSEMRFRHFYNKILKLNGLIPENPEDLNKPEGTTGLDIAFGPRIFRNDPEIREFFMHKYKLKEGSKLTGKVKPESYSDATFFPIMLALVNKKIVKSVTVPYYIHPEEQTKFETGKKEYDKKREDQKYDIVKGAIELARLLIENPERISELELVK